MVCRLAVVGVGALVVLEAAASLLLLLALALLGFCLVPERRLILRLDRSLPVRHSAPRRSRRVFLDLLGLSGLGPVVRRLCIFSMYLSRFLGRSGRESSVVFCPRCSKLGD